MSLPSGFIIDLKKRLSVSQIIGRKVTWDERKSNPSKGDYWAPCPFHNEHKTSSLHVDDRKGFYYCFGCQEKGDAITFIKSTENVEFMEAVEIFAQQAGIPMPAQNTAVQRATNHRESLVSVMEQSREFYQQLLQSASGTVARDYLTQRGLSEKTLERFEIGFAPQDRTALWFHLTKKGFEPEDIVESGMAVQPDKGAPYDRFRGRIMFPIRDARGACIAFAGRAVDPNARATYLNSPKTPLFDKNHSLFHVEPARKAASVFGQLIVVEGFMDVITLSQAGFDHAVGSLGTAVSEKQLHLMWGLCSEPLIAFDGDKMGLRAVFRLIKLALPLLKPGKSLRFCILPEGQDPDSILRTAGPSQLKELLSGSRSILDMIWERETDGKILDSPDRRAALDARMRAFTSSIRDTSIKTHYTAAVKELRRNLFATNPASLSNLQSAQLKASPFADAEYRIKQAIDARNSSNGLMAGGMAPMRSLNYIVCACSCGKKSEIEAKKLETILGDNLTPTNTLSLVHKMRCSECNSAPDQVFDDQENLLFDATISQKCTVCSEYIPIARSDAMPGTRLCIQCAIDGETDQKVPLPYPNPPSDMSTCPLCNSSTTMRQNADSQQWFVGCSDFPNCRWTQELKTPK